MTHSVSRSRVLFDRGRRRFLAGLTALAWLWLPGRRARGQAEADRLSRREAEFYRPLDRT